MKKFRKIAVIVICVALTLALFACGGNSGNSSDGSSNNNESSSSSETAEPESEQETNDDNEESANTVSNDAAKDYTQTIVDADGVKFEITGIDPDDFWGYTANVFLENTTDKSLMFAMDGVSVNGVMSDPFWASEVASGKKSNESISWSSSSFEEAGIEAVTEIEFRLRVYDRDNLGADELVNEVFKIYPLGEENAMTVVRTSSPDDVVLFENDDCKMTIIGVEEDGIFGYEVKTYLENKSDKTLHFGIDEGSINGFMADPYWGTSVMPGKVEYSDITWTKSTFEDNKIEEVESIEIRVQVRDQDNYSAESLVDDTFTIEP